ncbi:ComEC/Rec2 family competence protein, partial [Methylophaga lonarensis]
MIKSAIAFVAGCVAVLQLAVLPDSIWLLPAIIILLLSLWLRQTLLFCFTFAVLWTSLHSQLRLTDQLASHLQGQDLQITGVIASVPQREGRRLRFEFKPDQQIPVSKIRLNWYQIPDVVPAAGERWQLTVRLRQPFGMQNPGAFDYEGWLFREGIAATGYVRPDPANSRLETAARYSVNHLRMQIAERLQQLGNSELTPLLQGLSVGLRDQMTTEQWQILQKTGTSHLLAISGLHIGLAAGIGFFIGRWLWSLS